MAADRLSHGDPHYPRPRTRLWKDVLRPPFGCGQNSTGLGFGDERVQRERSGERPGGFRVVPCERSHSTPSPRLRRGKRQARQDSPHHRNFTSQVWQSMELGAVPSSSTLRVWVRQEFGEGAEPDPSLTVRNDDWDSLLLCCGPGNEPGEFTTEHFSASRFISRPNDDVLFGTAPVERGPGEELGLRLAQTEGPTLCPDSNRE